MAMVTASSLNPSMMNTTAMLARYGPPCCKSRDPEAGRVKHCRHGASSGGGNRCRLYNFRNIMCPVACQKCVNCGIGNWFSVDDRNISVLGLVGDAAGKQLKAIQCAHWNCSEALRLCAAHPECDVIEIAHTRAQHLRDTFLEAKASLLPARPAAVLRSQWVRWGPRVRPTDRTPRELAKVARILHIMHQCAALSSQAHQTVLGTDGVSRRNRTLWKELSCVEYCTTAGQDLPELRADAPRILEGSATGMTNDHGHCPPHDQPPPSLLLLGYQNGPSPWLCSFLQTLAHHGASATILGWQPRAMKRARKDFYFSAKIYSMLHFLLSCPLPGWPKCCDAFSPLSFSYLD